MERQSSFGSQGSGKSSATKIVKDAQKNGESVENQNANNAFMTALFGVLFTLAKEKYSDSWKIAVLTVVVDFFLILAIMLNLEYPWAVDPHNPLFKIFWSIEIHKPLSGAGYKFYLVIFYLLSAMLFLSVIVCVWVAWCFKNDSFPFLWPIKFVRVVASLFFGMLYIAALNIFLVILECAPSHGVWYQHVWHVECLAMPHLVHVVVAFLSSIVFAVAALLLVIADHELEPMTKSLLAAPHSMCELKAQLAKTVITVVDVLLWDFPKVQGIVFALCTILTFWYHLKQLPFYTSWMNSFRLCFFAVHAWVGLHLCVLVFAVKSHTVKKGSMGYQQWETENYETAKMITNSMAYGVPIVFFGAGLAGALRLYYFFRVALKFQIMLQQPTLYSKRVHRFSDDKEVEVVSRVARVWDEDGNLDQELLDLAEVILRAGIQQFPKSPYLHIVYANLLIECRQQLQSGWSQLEEARRMPLNLSYRFSIFTREQEHRQKAAVSSSGESAADLVSYVEFQRNWRLIQSYHKAALAAMREFWRLLLRDAVNLNSLTSAFRKIEQMEKLADRTYKVVLERYPKAVRLLRSYANFLETVKNDPWTAAEYYSEAEKQEEALENAENDLGGEEGLTMRNSAIITINAMGIIQMANKHASKMLGYSKGDLDGKNVSCLMPQPFSARHNQYMRNYVTTGKAKILDTLREVVALHHDRYVFPIKILVTKTQGTGADSIFMGLLKEVECDPNQIKAWVMPNGVTLCADQSLTDYAGWAPNDLIGKPFTNILVEHDEATRFIDMVAHYTEEEMASGAMQMEMDAHVIHKYAEEVPITLRADMGGTAGQRLLVLTLTRRGEVFPTLVFDQHGRVLFSNQALCSLLGTKFKDMRGKDIGTLLPQPFGYLHHRWIKDADAAPAGQRIPPASCRAGAVHSLLSANGVHIPVRVAITTRDANGVHVIIARMTRVTPEDALHDQRLSITTDQHGHILSITSTNNQQQTTSTPGTPWQPPAAADAEASTAPRPQVFGFPPEYLVGRKLYEAVDIFYEWHAQGHSVMHAVKALAQQSTNRPGAAWRVGVLPHYISAEAEKAAHKLNRSETKIEAEARADAAHAEGAREMTVSRHRSMRHSATMRTSLMKWKAAIMQVAGPEHTASGTLYTVRLWRPEMLSGVVELNERMVVVKADPAAGLIFGVPAYSMSQQPLSRFLKLGARTSGNGKPGAGGGGGSQPPLISKESLLGNKHVKGGMKGKVAHRTGPRRIFEARHADGMPLQISCQVALKNGNSNNRLMAAIKPLNLIKGNVAVLYAIMHGDDMDHTIADGVSASLYRSRSLNARAQSQALTSPPGMTHRVSSHDLQDRSAAAPALRKATSMARRAGVASDDGEGLALMKAGAKGQGGKDGAEGEKGVTVNGSDGPVETSHVQLDGLLGNNGGNSGNNSGLNSAAGDRAGKPEAGGLLDTARNDDAAQTPNGNDDVQPAAATAGPDAPADGNPDGEAAAKTEQPHGGSRPSTAQQMQSPPSQQRLHDSPPQLDGSGSGLSASGSGPGRPPISDDSAMMRSYPHSHHHPHLHDSSVGGKSGKEFLNQRFVTREWQDIVHVNPEEVPIPHDAEYDIDHHVGDEKDMTVSSGSSSRDSDGSESEEDQHIGKNTQGAADKMTREEALVRKKTMAALEPSERAGYVRGVKRVKEWLASGYFFDRRDAEPADEAAGGSEGHRPPAGPHRAVSKISEEPSNRGHGHGHAHDHSAHGHAGHNHTAHGHTTHAPARASTRQKSSDLKVVPEEGDGEDEDGEGKGRHHHHHHHKGSGLDPDDQLVTLEELAAEVDEHDMESEEEENRSGDGDAAKAEQEERGAMEEAEKGRGNRGRRGGQKAGWSQEDGDRGASQAATHGGTTRGGKSEGGEASSAGGKSGGSGMNRGRRLKRLLKLLSSRQVHRGVSQLRLHVLIVIGCMLLVHAVCFMLLVIYINKQKQFITEISAAGEAIDRSHYTAMYTRAIEAATRGSGFTSADIPALTDRLTSDVDRLEYLHQGLYLGFKGLRRSPSQKLKDLWDLPQWNVTEYQDTKVPTFKQVLLTLWNLGNEFIAAVREVAFYAAANKLYLSDSALAAAANATSNGTLVSGGTVATNVTLTSNRFWLFVRANVGESLYVGYLRVLNTVLILAQDNISMLKVILIALLLVEGCAVCFLAIGYVFWLLWKATRARAALFTVFLVIPQGQVKALASRHITTNDDESDEDEEEKETKQDNGADDGFSDGASLTSGAPGGNRRRSSAVYSVAPSEKSVYSMVAPGRAKASSITFQEKPGGKADGAGNTVLGRIKRALSAEEAEPATAGPPRRFFTRKRLTHTTTDIKNLAWPFFAWGALICIIYLVSYLQFSSVEESLVNLKMFERSTAQASRTMYYVNELALEADPTVQASLQHTVQEETSWLDTVYRTTLYGGKTLSDSSIDGAHDTNGGSLFAKEHHAALLFHATSCFRDVASTCLAEDDRYYQVTRHAIDPMMRRLMSEARLMSLDAIQDVNASSSRWQYMWQVARVDLHEGLADLVDSYRMDALASFKAQGTLHTVIFAVSWVLWAAYLWLLLKPYLQINSTETKRVAELLSQLPTELDVEGMVEESWRVVADTQLETSHLSVWDPKGQSLAHLAVKSAVSVFAAVSIFTSATRAGRRASQNGQLPADPFDDGAASNAGNVGNAASAFKDMLNRSQRSKAAEADDADDDAVVSKINDVDDGDDGGKLTLVGKVVDEPDAEMEMLEPVGKGLASAPQVSVLGSSLFGGLRIPLDAKPPRPSSGSRRNSATRISPSASAEGLPRPGSGGASGAPSAAAGPETPTRLGSMERVRQNKVVPVMEASASGSDHALLGAVPAGAKPRPMSGTSGSGSGGERPRSSLLDLPVGNALPPVAEDGPVAASPRVLSPRVQSPRIQSPQAPAKGVSAATGSAPGSRAGSDVLFNRVASPRTSITVAAREEAEQVSPYMGGPLQVEQSGGSAKGDGDGVGEDAVVAATAIETQDEVLLISAAEVAPEDQQDSATLPTSMVRTLSRQISLPGSTGSRTGSFRQVLLPPPPPLAAVMAANVSMRERLGGGLVDSPPGMPLVSAAAAAAAASRSGSLSGVKVVDRRSSLEPAGREAGAASGSAPASRVATPSRLGSAGQAGVDTNARVGGGASPARVGTPSRLSVQSQVPIGVAVVSRRSSLDAPSSRPASRLAGLAPSAASIAMPPPPAVNLAASAQAASGTVSRVASGASLSAESRPPSGGAGAAAGAMAAEPSSGRQSPAPPPRSPMALRASTGQLSLAAERSTEAAAGGVVSVTAPSGGSRPGTAEAGAGPASRPGTAPRPASRLSATVGKAPEAGGFADAA